MLRVAVQLDSRGLLRGYRASGHAGFARRGRDIVCAAATSLLRTVAAELSTHDELQCHGSAGEVELVLHVGDVPPSRAEWLRGVSDTLRRGLDDLQREYPRSVVVTTVDYRPAAAGRASVETVKKVMLGGV